MRTIYKAIESEIEIKKSRFISIIKNIQSIEEFNTCIEELKVKYPKATHYCYGYICGNIERFSDDGEPGGTAGTPILNVLKNTFGIHAFNLCYKVNTNIDDIKNMVLKKIYLESFKTFNCLERALLKYPAALSISISRLFIFGNFSS